MKITRVPNLGELEQAYSRLQWPDAAAPTIEEIVLWSLWARVDPRLAELLIGYFVRNFRSLSPLDLRETNLRSPLPASLAVLIEFASAEAKGGLSKEESEAFRAWAKSLLWKIPPAPPQIFFIRNGKPSPERDLREVYGTLRTFRRWGFFGSSAPLPGKGSQGCTLLPKARRREILKNLLRLHGSLRVEDYIQACGGAVHRGTAERDLATTPDLAPIGRTRARRYRKGKP